MTDETNKSGWPIDDFTDEDLDEIDKTISSGMTVDPSVISRLVKELRETRNQNEELTDDRNAMKKLEEIAREHWDTEVKQGDGEPRESGFAFIRYMIAELSRGYGWWRSMKAVIEEQENKLHHHYGSFGAADRLRYIFRNLERKAEQSQFAYHHLKEDMLVWARAVGLAANMAANGGTHREINARMRGLIEMIESAVTAIRDAKEDERHGFYGAHVPDVFRSDYPVREHLRRIHELERELERERKLRNGDEIKAEDLF